VTRDPDRVDVPVFAALDIGHTIDDDGRHLPTVAIDAADSPAVADLARVHAVEGVGDIRTAAVRADDLLLLGVRVTVPVRAAFAIAFNLKHHRGFLDDVIERGSLVIAHTDPGLAAVERPHWLAVDIDGAALAESMASE
jgi:hypothetical protein